MASVQRCHTVTLCSVLHPPTMAGCMTSMPPFTKSKKTLKKSKPECDAPDPRLVVEGPCQRKPSSHMQDASLNTHAVEQCSQPKQVHFEDVPTPSDDYHDSGSDEASSTALLTHSEPSSPQEDLHTKNKSAASSKKPASKMKPLCDPVKDRALEQLKKSKYICSLCHCCY